jgi:hypothetical protein
MYIIYKQLFNVARVFKIFFMHLKDPDVSFCCDPEGKLPTPPQVTLMN